MAGRGLGVLVLGWVLGATGCAVDRFGGVEWKAVDAGPEGMVWIPGGEYERGDHSGMGYVDERPVRRVEVSGFWMDRTEVTWELWNEVHAWAVAHGYEFDDSYDFHPGRDGQHPVCNVSWFDAVKWCNARSEKEGRQPSYYADAEAVEVYRRGQVELTGGMVRWESGGFRLPTEAEWEWAARGGLAGHHFPWPSPGLEFAGHLDGERANYWESGDPWESEAECATSPVAHFSGGQVPANGYGLADMAGNVAEWCWDWYLDRWYEWEESGWRDTRGPAAGYGRVLRGGSWISRDKYCRVSARYMSAADYRCHCYGLRCVVGEWGRTNSGRGME
jgi:formylglycine-generating enzyme